MFLAKFTEKLYVQRRFSENRAIYEMWKNVEPDRRQMTTQNDACPFHAG